MDTGKYNTAVRHFGTYMQLSKSGYDFIEVEMKIVYCLSRINRRPVLVVQSDPFNRSKISKAICVAIISNLAIAQAPGNVRLSKQDSNLPRESVINVSQILTIDRSHLINCVGSVPKRIIVEVDEGLRAVPGLT